MAAIMVAVHAGGACVKFDQDGPKLRVGGCIVAQLDDAALEACCLDACDRPAYCWVDIAMDDSLLHVDVLGVNEDGCAPLTGRAPPQICACYNAVVFVGGRKFPLGCELMIGKAWVPIFDCFVQSAPGRTTLSQHHLHVSARLQNLNCTGVGSDLANSMPIKDGVVGSLNL